MSESNRSLVMELLEAQEEAGKLGLLDRPDAAKQSQARGEALTNLRRLAVADTFPEQWLLYKDKDGAEVAGMKKGAASIIRQYLAISCTPDGPAQRFDRDGKTGWEVFGSATCEVSKQRLDHIRAKRLTDEKFTGRTDVGEEDVRDAARTSFDTKCTAMLSGLVAVPLPFLASCWGMKTEDEARRRIAKGMGYGSSKKREESRPAQVQEPEFLVSEEVEALVEACSTRLAQLKAKFPDAPPTTTPKRLLIECIKLVGIEKDPDDGQYYIPRVKTGALRSTIAGWGEEAQPA